MEVEAKYGTKDLGWNRNVVEKAEISIWHGIPKVYKDFLPCITLKVGYVARAIF